MAQIRHDCPYCRTKSSAFNLIFSASTGTVQRIGGGLGLTTYYCYDAFGQCQGCGCCVVVSFIHDGRDGEPHSCNGDPADSGYIFECVYPEAGVSTIPEEIPDRIKDLLSQAADNLGRENWEASGMASRKVLEVGTRIVIRSRGDEDIKSKLKKMTLFDRINILRKTDLLTEDLTDWAHDLRLGGNEAAHEDDPISEIDARSLYDYADLFVRYVFMLPNILADRRGNQRPFQDEPTVAEPTVSG